MRPLSSSFSILNDLGMQIEPSTTAQDLSGRGRPLTISGLKKTFRRANGSLVRAIDDVSITVQEGEFLVLLGPSGCGKTTLLRSVAGLEYPDEGKITLGDETLYDSSASLDMPPEKRHIGMVFQSYALWPHMSVLKNVSYPLRMRGASRADRATRATGILEKMRIGDLAHQNPARISGGQQQRVALARALVCGDDLILFDEPLSNVDAKVREFLRLEILTMQREFGFTALYVTHDQEEAMGLATRIAVVDSGAIAQIGTPQELYTQPNSLGVARFLGTAVEISGTLDRTGTIVSTSIGSIDVSQSKNRRATGDAVTLVTRPEKWRFSEGGDGYQGSIVTSAFLGPITEHVVQLDTVDGSQCRIVMRGSEVTLRPPGTRVACVLDETAVMVFDREEA
jgi:iron(III) transport system ATP-binding protein